MSSFTTTILWLNRTSWVSPIQLNIQTWSRESKRVSQSSQFASDTMSKRLNTASINLITTHFRPTSTQRATALVARCTPTTSCPDPASCTQCWADSSPSSHRYAIHCIKLATWALTVSPLKVFCKLAMCWPHRDLNFQLANWTLYSGCTKT